MVTDPIGDLFTRIRNASRAGHLTITVPSSAAKVRILNVLKEEGYVDRVDSFKDQKGKAFVKVFLRYTQDGEPVVREVTRLSKPGRRLYRKSVEIKPFKGGLGVTLISSSSGVITDKKARELGVGGELLASIF